jgi:transposase
MEPNFELTDEQWGLISDLFDDPEPSPLGGRPRASSRACFEAVAWILRTGARWRDLPSRFPSYPTCWRRLKEWSESGIFKKAWARLLQLLDRQGNIDREESIADGTFSPAKKGGFV